MADALTFEVRGTHNGRAGKWRLNAPTIAAARQQATAKGIDVADVVFVPVQAPNPEAPAEDAAAGLTEPARRSTNAKPSPALIKLHWRDAFNLGFYAGLGAWCAMVMLSLVFGALGWVLFAALVAAHR